MLLKSNIRLVKIIIHIKKAALLNKVGERGKTVSIKLMVGINNIEVSLAIYKSLICQHVNCFLSLILLSGKHPFTM